MNATELHNDDGTLAYVACCGVCGRLWDVGYAPIASGGKQWTSEMRYEHVKAQAERCCNWRREIEGVTERARKLARQINESGDWSALPALHDMLVEAGCEEETLLPHLLGCEMCPTCLGSGLVTFAELDGKTTQTCGLCRGTGRIHLRHPHVRGCWALAAIVGE